MPWLTQSVRLSLFVTPEALTVQPPTWQALTNTEPENRLARTTVLQVEEGPFAGARLQLRTQQAPPPRIDLFLVLATAAAESGVPPSLGSFDEVMQSMRVPSERLLRSGIATVRLALGVVHVQPADDIQDANRILQESVGPTRLRLENARDFVYRINRPRVSAWRPGAG